MNEILVESIQEQLKTTGQIVVVKDNKKYIMKDLMYVGSKDDYKLAPFAFSEVKVWLKDYQKNWEFEMTPI